MLLQKQKQQQLQEELIMMMRNKRELFSPRCTDCTLCPWAVHSSRVSQNTFVIMVNVKVLSEKRKRCKAGIFITDLCVYVQKVVLEQATHHTHKTFGVGGNSTPITDLHNFLPMSFSIVNFTRLLHRPLGVPGLVATCEPFMMKMSKVHVHERSAKLVELQRIFKLKMSEINNLNEWWHLCGHLLVQVRNLMTSLWCNYINIFQHT